jgi:MFS family permease
MALNIYLQIFGKFICGFGNALILVSVTIYVSETLPGQYIGKCLTAFNIGISTGFVLSSIVQVTSLPAKDDPAFDTTEKWRIGFSVPIIIVSLINLA